MGGGPLGLGTDPGVGDPSWMTRVPDSPQALVLLFDSDGVTDPHTPTLPHPQDPGGTEGSKC